MCILINENGRVFANENIINESLFPVQTGKFTISNEAEKFIETELNENNTSQLFQFIPKEMFEFCEDKKLISTKASIFKNDTEKVVQSRSEASQIPHINGGNEVHFFFDGSYIIY